MRETENRRGTEPWPWSGRADVLLRDLAKEARTVSDREAYRELLRTPTCRLGLTVVLGAKGRVASIVVVLVDRSRNAASIEAALTRRGYTSMRLDEGWIVHERAFSRRSLGAELQILRDLLQTAEAAR